MLRSLWIILSTLAVANLFALAGFVAWLAAGDRLSRERVESVRAVFASTVSDEQARLRRERAAEEAARAAAEEAARIGAPPLTADRKLEQDAARDEAASQQARRVQRETSDLINTLMQERAELDRQREIFQREVDAFNRMRAAIAQQEGSEQFQKAVALYQLVKPAEARAMMQSLIRKGETDQVVSYLDAIQPRTASRIITEFQNEDPDLAADLLERLRVRGTTPASSPVPVAAAAPEG
jgi:hypothetical protein